MSEDSEEYHAIPKRGKPKSPTADQYLAEYKAGNKPVVNSTAFKQKVKDFCELLPDYTDEFHFECGGRTMTIHYEADNVTEQKTYHFGRAKNVEVDFEKITTRQNTFSIPNNKPKKVLLDTGVLLILGIEPSLLIQEVSSLVKTADQVYYSPSSIGQIHEWLNGNEIIKDNIRRGDFIELLTRGLLEVPITSKIKEDAMTLRGEFKGTDIERETIACARNVGATVISVSENVAGYEFVGKV